MSFERNRRGDFFCRTSGCNGSGTFPSSSGLSLRVDSWSALLRCVEGGRLDVESVESLLTGNAPRKTYGLSCIVVPLPEAKDVEREIGNAGNPSVPLCGFFRNIAEMLENLGCFIPICDFSLRPESVEMLLPLLLPFVLDALSPSSSKSS